MTETTNLCRLCGRIDNGAPKCADHPSPPEQPVRKLHKMPRGE